MTVPRSLLVPIVISGLALRLGAQAPATPSHTRSLTTEIARMDSTVFAAFNARDITTLQTFFAPELEFYQEDEGLENYAQTVKDFGGMFHQPARIRRTLVRGSLHVYPVKNYGAIETGSHRFCHEENGKPECETFKFLHVWRKTGDRWQLTRIFSYAH